MVVISVIYFSIVVDVGGLVWPVHRSFISAGWFFYCRYDSGMQAFIYKVGNALFFLLRHATLLANAKIPAN